MYNFNNNIATPRQQQQHRQCQNRQELKESKYVRSHKLSFSFAWQAHVKFYIM